MRTLTQLHFVLVSRKDPAKPLCAEDKSGMKGIMVLYSKANADEFIAENGMTGAIIPKKINGIPDLWVLGGLGEIPFFCVMEREAGKYEGEFFPFSQFPECKRIDNPELIADPFARGLAGWAEKKYGKPQPKTGNKTAQAPSTKALHDTASTRPWWKFW
jgi:hypothetical protein